MYQRMDRVGVSRSCSFKRKNYNPYSWGLSLCRAWNGYSKEYDYLALVSASWLFDSHPTYFRPGAEVGFLIGTGLVSLLPVHSTSPVSILGAELFHQHSDAFHKEISTHIFK